MIIFDFLPAILAVICGLLHAGEYIIRNQTKRYGE
jgi:hypothetical protein